MFLVSVGVVCAIVFTVDMILLVSGLLYFRELWRKKKAGVKYLDCSRVDELLTSGALILSVLTLAAILLFGAAVQLLMP